MEDLATIEKRQSPDYPVTMRVVDYAKRTGIGVNKMRELTRAEGFPSVFVGRRILVLVEPADKWLLARQGQQL